MSETFGDLTIRRRRHKAMNLVLKEQVTIKNNRSSKCLLLGNPEIVQASGKDEGSVQVETKLPHGRFVRLSFGTINVSERDEVLVALNPKLASACLLSGPVIIPPREEHELSISLYTVKQIDLAEHEWIVALYYLT
jgi:hypothetical protein